MSSPTRSLLVSATIGALVIGAPGTASAQNVIPGDVNAGKVVMTSLPGVSVTVTQPSLSAVAVAVSNTSGKNLTCAGADGRATSGVTVSSAPVAQAAVEYYSTFAFKPDPVTVFGSAGNLNNQPQNITAQVPFGPVLGLLPSGSIAPMFGDAYAARDWISRSYTEDLLAGHGGTAPFPTTAHGATQSVTVTLSPPNTGARTDFTAAAFLVCTDPTGQAYAFAGYEGGSAPSPTNAGTLPIGSVSRR